MRISLFSVFLISSSTVGPSSDGSKSSNRTYSERSAAMLPSILDVAETRLCSPRYTAASRSFLKISACFLSLRMCSRSARFCASASSLISYVVLMTGFFSSTSFRIVSLSWPVSQFLKFFFGDRWFHAATYHQIGCGNQIFNL